MVSEFFRRFSRRGNALLIWLTLEQWPSRIPLPPGAVLHVTGDGPYQPYWEVVLDENKTEEHLFGWFQAPVELTTAAEWYRDAMVRGEWNEDLARSRTLARQYHLHFDHTATQAWASIRLSKGPRLATMIMIRSALRTPWQPSPSLDVEVGFNSPDDDPDGLPNKEG